MLTHKELKSRALARCSVRAEFDKLEEEFAFLDSHRVILDDLEHGGSEKRFYCLGRVSEGIMTVRFTYRNNKIRILGAGYWRKGRRIYERENKIHG